MFSSTPQTQNARTNPVDYAEGERGTFLVPLPPINRLNGIGRPILNNWGAKYPKKDWPPEVIDQVQLRIIEFNEKNPNRKVSLNPDHWRIDLTHENGGVFALVDAPLRKNLTPISRLVETICDFVIPRPSSHR
jgi:hypothetical protein